MSIPIARLARRDVIPVYTGTAPLYDLWAMFTETSARMRALALAGIRNGESVLEVAVGTGLTFQELVRRNPDGYTDGIDLTPAMLARAQDKATRIGARNYRLAAGDAYALDFPDSHFDVLLNSYMFDLLPEADFSIVLLEFKRVLKPGGRLILVNMTRPERFYQRIWETIYQFNPKWLGGCRGVLLAPALNESGFQDIHRETVSQFGFPSEIVTARRPF